MMQTASEKRPASPLDERDFQPPKPRDLDGRIPNIEILDLVGQGGMGAVYKARQVSLNRVVAVKIIKPSVTDQQAFAERFAREAEAMARLNHPNIVTVFDFGQTKDLFYLVMEYVDGVTLRRLIRTKEITPQQAMSIVPEVCDALQFAHDQGVVHRDIKPENILVDRQGHVRIADFGLAKLSGQTGHNWTLTKTGQFMGTPSYMAPEQIERPIEVDHRADIYSLGVVFYEMLTGELPMGRFEPPSQRVKIDVRLDEVVLHALEKQPEKRYQLASQVSTDVKSLLGGYYVTPSQAADEEREYKIEFWLNLVVALALTPAIFFGMIYTDSITPMFGFCLSWLLLGGTVEGMIRPRTGIWWICGFVFVCSIAAIIISVVRSESADAFWGLGAMFVAFAIGCAFGDSAKKEKLGKTAPTAEENEGS